MVLCKKTNPFIVSSAFSLFYPHQGGEWPSHGVPLDVMRWSARHPELWLLLLAVALAAMTAGHAVELGFENAALFGDDRAGYAHLAQGPIVDLAVALFLIALGVLLLRFVRGAFSSGSHADWLLPALERIRSMGISGAALRIISVQVPALAATELAEQRLSGIVHPSLAAVFGHGHVTAPFVQLAFGVIAACAIVACARFLCAHAGELVRAARTVAVIFVAMPHRPAVHAALRLLAANDSTRLKRRALLALRRANRPPPAIATARA